MLVSAHIAASVRTRIETSLLPPLTTVWRFTWSAWRRMRDSNSRGLAPNTLSKSVDVRSRQVSVVCGLERRPGPVLCERRRTAADATQN